MRIRYNSTHQKFWIESNIEPPPSDQIGTDGRAVLNSIFTLKYIGLAISQPDEWIEIED